ncbi:oligosaccharide flippase family protein [Flavobacterium macacae]|uniref:oligosaccharide flippase family protein n=1 Tax=Flavobacterium macacae TaxID=2488993 RepID=UPI0013153F16|nr:oligosaccharide flippase family protein [Flavobacterium macacae]
MNKILNSFRSSKALKNFIIYGFGQAVNLVSPLLITPYIIYICGLEKLGVIAVGQSLAYILNVIIDYSSNIIGVKEISISREDNSKIQQTFSEVYISRVFLFLAVFLFISVLIFTIPYFEKNALLIFLSTSIILGQAINPTWFLQGIENFKWITIINILAKVIYIVCILLFLKKESDYILTNFWLGLGTILANILAFVWIIQKFKIKFKSKAIQGAKRIIKRDFMFCVSQFFFAIRNYSSVLVIGFFASDFVAGQFKVIEQIINLFRTYLQMFFKFTYTYVCFRIDKSMVNGLILWKKYNGLNLIFLIGLLFLAFLFSDQVLLFFKVGAELINKLSSYLRLALLLPFLIAITLPLEQLIFNFSKNKEYIRLTIFSTIINILGLTILIRFSEDLKYSILLLIGIEMFLILAYLILLKSYLFDRKLVER